jgi:hypothetical protein
LNGGVRGRGEFAQQCTQLNHGGELSISFVLLRWGFLIVEYLGWLLQSVVRYKDLFPIGIHIIALAYIQKRYDRRNIFLL